MKSFSHEKKEKERTLYATGLSFNAKRGEGNKKKKNENTKKKEKKRGERKQRKILYLIDAHLGNCLGLFLPQTALARELF